MNRYLALLLTLLLAVPAFAGNDARKKGGGGGGGNAIPGYVDAGTSGLGDERTLQYIYDLDHFKGLDNYKKLYFSADTDGYIPIVGSDSNPCTIDRPCLSIDKAEQIAQESCFVNLVFDTDWWDTAAEWGGTGDGTTGITTSRNCSVTDGRPSVVVSSISKKRSEPFHFSCERLTNTQETEMFDDGVFATGGAAPNGAVMAIENFHIYRCPAEPFNATDAQGSDVMRGAIIALNGYCEESAGDLMQCYTNHPSLGDYGGVMLNVRWKPRPSSDFHSDCVGATCGTLNDPDLADGTKCSAADTPWNCCDDVGGGVFDCVVGAGVQYANVAANVGTTIISPHTYTGVEGFREIIGGNTGPSYTIIGPVIEESATATQASFGISVTPQIAAQDRMDIRLAKTVIRGFNDASDMGFVVGNSGGAGDTGPVNVELYQTTFDANTIHLRQQGQFAGANGRQDYKARCSVFDGESAEAISIGTITDTDDIINFDITTSAWDNDNAADSFVIDNTGQAAASNARTTIAAATNSFYCQDNDTSCTTGFFGPDGANNLEITGDVFGTLTGTSACDADSACHTVLCAASYTIELPSGGTVHDAAIPPFVLGTDEPLTEFLFNQDADQDLGGR